MKEVRGLKPAADDVFKGNFSFLHGKSIFYVFVCKKTLVTIEIKLKTDA